MALLKSALQLCQQVPKHLKEKIDSRISIIARESYGRLLALLASKTSDLASAEDALASAFSKALENWSLKGIPNNPEGWLLTVARNVLRDLYKSSAHRSHVDLDCDNELYETMSDIDAEEIPDERLKLLFVCAHPAINPNIRTPLMLQTVLHVEATDIASAFIMPASTMAQRLVRAKRKIKAAAIPFVIPAQSEMKDRLASVLEAIYGAFSIEQDLDQVISGKNDLKKEAIFLADLLVKLMPEQAEVLGLAALLHFSSARQGAQFSESGEFVPLENQDMTLWKQGQIKQAERLLYLAKKHKQLGRFQLEAAIQAVHCSRIYTGKTNWQALALLYQGLLQFYPTIGAATGRAVAFGIAYGPDAGLQCLADIDDESITRFQPAWVSRATLLVMKKDYQSAICAYAKAIELTTNIAIRRHLESKMSALF